MNKFHAKRTQGADGLMFDSKREAERWGELRMMERAGYITELQRQVAYVLSPPVRLGTSSHMKPALRLIVDFQYRDDLGNLVLEDTKGVVTDVFRVKQHLLKAIHGLEVRLTK